MPWKVTDIMDERRRFVIMATQGVVNFSSLCRDFGISRPTGYLWLNRYLKSGSLTSVVELSRRPHHVPSRTSPELEERVISLRRRYGWGAKKLRELLLEEGLDMKVVTINRILKRNDLISREDSHRPAVKHFERRSPNELWQMDFKGDYAADRGRCYPLSLLDDHSRFAIGLYALKGQTTESVQGCLIDAFERFGVPQAMLMDHGVPWWSTTNGHGLTRLSVSLINQGIKLCFSGFRHPQTQGKVERFHKTLEGFVSHHGSPSTFSEWQDFFKFFVDEYNHVRPHESLGMARPAEYYQPSRKEYCSSPPEWEYPSGSLVKRLNPQGCLDYKQRRYFVCEALAGQRVRIEHLDKKLIVSYRHIYIREIDKKTARSASLLTPVESRKM